jgi:hypothetical protein
MRYGNSLERERALLALITGSRRKSHVSRRAVMQTTPELYDCVEISNQWSPRAAKQGNQANSSARRSAYFLLEPIKLVLDRHSTGHKYEDPEDRTISDDLPRHLWCAAHLCADG